jgi:hypothetical protein
MDKYTSITYSLHEKDNETIKKIEYNFTLKDDDNKMINTYYNNSISNDTQNESFTKTLKDSHNIFEQIGISENKEDWKIKEFHNSDYQKEYVDDYNKHSFMKTIIDSIPSLANMNGKNMIENQ